jgi:hypothetical protein
MMSDELSQPLKNSTTQRLSNLATQRISDLVNHPPQPLPGGESANKAIELSKSTTQRLSDSATILVKSDG